MSSEEKYYTIMGYVVNVKILANYRKRNKYKIQVTSAPEAIHYYKNNVSIVEKNRIYDRKIDAQKVILKNLYDNLAAYENTAKYYFTRALQLEGEMEDGET